MVQMSARNDHPAAGRAILIGNSDGIGLATTKILLERGWRIEGISRSESPVDDPSYTHSVARVEEEDYPEILRSLVSEDKPLDLCIYFVGIGDLLDVGRMDKEVNVFEVNLMGMVKTAAVVIPAMVRLGGGHFIGLSSVADAMLSPEAPSYHASKAGFSTYLESLALALKPKGVFVSNVRFGFVDTKMAKGDVRPFMMSVERAAGHMLKVIERRPYRYTAPWFVNPLVKFRDLTLRLKAR
jgi:short-subunit dehydrogenase